MPQDNTLGAPTEGLGQTVTFAVNQGGGVPQLQLPDRGSARMGEVGGSATSTGRAQQVAEAKPDPTLAALMKIGGALLAPMIKEQRQTKFMEGMQRASEGEAVKEIVDEQPWYAKVFGPTSLVDGARAYSAAAKAAAIATDLDARMPEISKMSGPDFARHTNKMLTEQRTGDSTTDAIVEQQFLEQLPEVMKKQARSHFLYQQGQMIEANRSYVGTVFKKLSTADAMRRNTPDTMGPAGQMPAGATDEGDTLKAELDTLQAMQTPEGMDPGVHKKVLAAEVVQSVNAGSFAVVNMLERSGAMAQFEPAQAAQIRGAVSAERQRVRAELPAEFAKVIHSAREAATQPNQTADGVIAAVDALNKAYARVTGDERPYVTAQGTDSLLQLMAREQAADLAAAQRKSASATTAADKDAAKLEEVRVVMGALQSGSPVNGATGDAKRAAWGMLARNAPEAVAGIRAQNYATTKDEDYADALRNSIVIATKAGSGATMYQTYTSMYLPLINASGDVKEDAALAYAGEQAQVMSAFHRYIKGKQNPTQIDIDVAYSMAIQPKPKEPGKLEQAVAAELTTGKLGKLYSLFPNDDVPLKDPAGLALMLAPSVVSGPDIGDAVKAAKANNRDINIMGGFHWRRGANQADLASFFEKTHTVASDQRNRAVAMGVQAVAAENALDEVTSIRQVGNTNDGKPQLVVMGMMPNGDPAFGLLSAQRIEDLWAVRDKTKQPELPIPDARNVGKSAADLALERFRKEQSKTK
jgi:hypothetical protein